MDFHFYGERIRRDSFNPVQRYPAYRAVLSRFSTGMDIYFLNLRKEPVTDEIVGTFGGETNPVTSSGKQICIS
jgi:hypothetical protein